MVWQITDYELLERYADGERNFAGIELIYSGYRRSKHRGIDLDGVVLRDINLRGAYLNEVMMIGADLTGADLGGIFMRGCCLSEGIVRDANLCAANVRESGFINTDLRGSNLNFINASFAEFRGAKIQTLESAILARTNFEGAYTHKDRICRGDNLIWRTIMPDGTIVEGPQWGNGRNAR